MRLSFSMGQSLLVLEIEGATASEDQNLVKDVVAFVKAHRGAGPSSVKGTLVHAAFYRAEA